MGQSAQMPEFTPFGTVFQPIGFIGGKPVWPILGGAPEDGTGDGSQDGSGNGDGAGQSAGDGDGNGDGTDGNGQGTGDADGDQRPVTREEFDRLRAQLSAADKNKSQAEKDLAEARAKLKQFEDKDRTELEKAQNDLKEAVEARDSALEKLRDFQIIEAFRNASEAEKPPLNWHNTKVAMGQLDSNLYKIEDDGSVTGMDKAVKALAKDHEYLLKKEQGAAGKSGGSFNNGSGGGNKTADAEKLKNKYAALRGRGGA